MNQLIICGLCVTPDRWAVAPANHIDVCVTVFLYNRHIVKFHIVTRKICSPADDIQRIHRLSLSLYFIQIGMQQHYTLGGWLRRRYVDTGYLSKDYKNTEVLKIFGN